MGWREFARPFKRATPTLDEIIHEALSASPIYRMDDGRIMTIVTDDDLAVLTAHDEAHADEQAEEPWRTEANVMCFVCGHVIVGTMVVTPINKRTVHLPGQCPDVPA